MHQVPKSSRRTILIIVCLVAMALPSPNQIFAQSEGLSGVIRVRVAEVAALEVGGTSSATAVVAAFRKATVAAEVSGRIIERKVEPGTIARKGQTLVLIDRDRSELVLRQTQAMAQASKVDVEHARHEYQRGQRLFKKNVISKDTVDDLHFAERGALAKYHAAQVEVARAQRELKDTNVTSPFAGQIETVHVQVGDYVNPGQAIITLTDFSKARLIAGVTSREATVIRASDQALAVFDDLGGQTVVTRVTSVGRIKDQYNGTYPVELLLEGESAVNQLREGMIANVIWQSQSTGQSRLSVPSSALVRRAGQIGTYIVEDGHAVLKDIRIGKSDGRRVEVLAGLEAGQQVVIEGQFALRDGAMVETTASQAN